MFHDVDGEGPTRVVNGDDDGDLAKNFQYPPH